MSEIRKPETFKDAMVAAREFTGASQQAEAFDIYFGLAKLSVANTLGAKLDELPVSDDHKRSIIEREAYAIAQPAHLEDGGYAPFRLLGLLDQLGVFEPNA